MDRTFWHKQTKDKPLFPDLLWSRPEQRRHAGKLGIVGGNAMGFAAPAAAYGAAVGAGIGTARVLLPDSLQGTIGRTFEAGEYAPRTPSGSLARSALSAVMELAGWADGMLLAGDFGHNSETAILLESFVQAYSGQLTIAQDGVDYFVDRPALLDRADTVLVLNFGQLQKLATGARFEQPFTSTMDFLHLIDQLHSLSQKQAASLVVERDGQVFVADDGLVSTTPVAASPTWQVTIAAGAAVWWLQNPGQTFEAITTAVVD